MLCKAFHDWPLFLNGNVGKKFSLKNIIEFIFMVFCLFLKFEN